MMQLPAGMFILIDEVWWPDCDCHEDVGGLLASAILISLNIQWANDQMVKVNPQADEWKLTPKKHFV